MRHYAVNVIEVLIKIFFYENPVVQWNLVAVKSQITRIIGLKLLAIVRAKNEVAVRSIYFSKQLCQIRQYFLVLVILMSKIKLSCK